jgi:hypothetical protein
MAFSPDLVARHFDASGLALAILLRRADQPSSKKRKGLQLALEPLNGPGIAGYVPKP